MAGSDTVDLEHLRGWIGRTQEVVDRIDPWRPAALHATLDLDGDPPAPGDAVPPGWHWLYFHEAVAGRNLGEDGHAALGDFLPPVPLPQRMWAGGRLAFHAPLPIGVEARRRSTVAGVTLKQGSQGPLVFVSVVHEIAADDTLALTEVQEIVYRNASAAAPGREPRSARPRAASPALWQRGLRPDAALLFRYSALTFNSHRIHYDADYCRAAGYPAPVVHGPLIATLLLDLVRRSLPSASVASFEFRARSPLFCGEDLVLQGSLGDESSGEVVLNADGPEQRWLMSACARLAV